MTAISIFAWVLTGGIGLKVVEHFLNRGKDKLDFAAKLRDELRKDLERYQEEVENLKTEVEGVRDDLDIWKNNYFKLLEDQGKLKETNLQQQRELGYQQKQISDQDSKMKIQEMEITNLRNLLKRHNIEYEK